MSLWYKQDFRNYITTSAKCDRFLLRLIVREVTANGTLKAREICHLALELSNRNICLAAEYKQRGQIK